MPKTLYRYSQEQRKQKPADILATDSGFQSNEVYLTFVQNLKSNWPLKGTGGADLGFILANTNT